MVEFVCSCGTVIDVPNEYWTQEGDKLINDSLVCSECNKTFRVIFDFNILECKDCGEAIDYCECKMASEEDEDDI